MIIIIKKQHPGTGELLKQGGIIRIKKQHPGAGELLKRGGGCFDRDRD